MLTYKQSMQFVHLDRTELRPYGSGYLYIMLTYSLHCGVLVGSQWTSATNYFSLELECEGTSKMDRIAITILFHLSSSACNRMTMVTS